MNKLKLNILLLVAIVWGISALVRSQLPYFWANEGWEVKHQWLEEHSAEYNALFIGSSHIYRQINPRVFDKQLDASLAINSFNLGYQATANPESHYLYEQLLQDERVDLSGLKLVVMDLVPAEWLNLNNARSVRGKYFMNVPYWWRGTTQVLTTDRSDLEKRADVASHYSIALFEKEFNVGMYDEIREYYEKDKDSLQRKDLAMLGGQRNGFLALDNDRGYAGRRRAFLECEEYLVPMSAANTEYYYECTVEEEHDQGSGSSALLREANRLIALSKERGIHLVFVMMPRTPYRETFPIAEALPPAHVVNLTDPREYPEFYDLQYVFDRGHLNQKGARLLSERLGEKVNQLLLEDLAASSKE